MKIIWNKVTPLSKALALMMLVLFPIAGFCIGYRYGTFVERERAMEQSIRQDRLNRIIPTPATEQRVGGDRDAHGCIGSAGYSWCDAKQKCLRIWEEPCDAASASSTALRPNSNVSD
jgi:hypothetical protein